MFRFVFITLQENVSTNTIVRRMYLISVVVLISVLCIYFDKRL